MQNQLKKCLLTTLAAALTVRVVYGVLFSATELAAFNSIKGLDMDTLLSFSEWNTSIPASAPMFVLHRFMLFFLYMLCGGAHNFMLIYIAQALAGTAASVCAAWSVWMLSKNIRTAFTAGIIYALYGPFLLYESVALQEAVLTHTLTIGFAFYVWFVKSGRISAGVTAGLILGMNSAGRPATAFLAIVLALLPFVKERKFALKNFSVPCAIAAVWLTASLFNGHFRGNYSPFFNVMPHLVELHAPQSAAATPAGGFSSTFRVLWGAIKNVPQLFGMREIPENLDYDVIRQILPILSLGPLLVMPFAISGAAAAAAMKRKEFLLLCITCGALLLPLAARIPIGRYRLMLMPFFIAFAAIFITELIENSRRRAALICIVIGVLGTNMLLASPLVRPNPAAHHTFALAAIKRGTDPAKHLEKAWELSGHTYKSSGLMLVLQYLKKSDFSSAEKIISQDKSNSAEFTYYLALVRIAQNRLPEANSLLQQIREPEKLGELYPKYLKLVSFVNSRI